MQPAVIRQVRKHPKKSIIFFADGVFVEFIMDAIGYMHREAQLQCYSGQRRSISVFYRLSRHKNCHTQETYAAESVSISHRIVRFDTSKCSADSDSRRSLRCGAATATCPPPAKRRCLSYRFYDKDIEQSVKHNILLDKIGSWKRTELELRDDKVTSHLCAIGRWLRL